MNKHILIILDGYGIAENPTVSAIDHAKKPFLDSLFQLYPHSTLEASGLAVGLPAGQMGNSEVGHTNLGAGRIVYQDITRIDKEISEGSFFQNEVLQEAFKKVLHTQQKIHLLGLLSDGGVHSMNTHLYALLQMAKNIGLEKNQVCIHAFTDGRDTAPNGGKTYLSQLLAKTEALQMGTVVSVIGRYYAMDRDNRWERTQKGYDLLVNRVGTEVNDYCEAIERRYELGETDEFLEPMLLENTASDSIKDGDSILCFNFRADRMRQLCKAFLFQDFDEFPTHKFTNLHLVTFTPYDQTFHVPIAFPKIKLTNTLGAVIASTGNAQLRAAETEKYPHVTYFFNGGRETPFENEERILVPSPKVATYDLQPEMSALPLAKKVVEAIKQKDFQLIILNFANPDMVGHTGVFEAAIKAVETVDEATRLVITAALEQNYSVEIIADHGNADKMKNEDGSPHTAHTTALVPHLIIKDGFYGPIQPGKLGDIAPTILALLGLPIPQEMEGEVLVSA